LHRIEKSIVIRAPPEKVWEMLAWDRHPEWNKGVKSAEYTSEVRTPEDKFRVGASAHVTGPEEFDVEIMGSLENEKIAGRYLGIGGARNVTGTYTLKSTEAGTEMTLVAEYEVTNLILKMIDKLYNYIKGEKDLEKSLEKLKSILEKQMGDDVLCHWKRIRRLFARCLKLSIGRI